MEFEDQEKNEKEIVLPPSYDSLGNSSRVKMSSSGVGGGGTNNNEATSLSGKKPAGSRYRECQKNHAVGIGGHAIDGCGEFMPAGADGTLDALKCAACNCHRNFHRKEMDASVDHQNQPLFPHQYLHHHQQSPSQPQPVYQFYPYTRTPAGYLHVATQQQRSLALPSPCGGGTQSGEDQEDVSNPSGTPAMMGSVGMASKKRFRTKFTQEQKDRMLGLAEQLGWRIQKQDEAVVQQFCHETGVKRHVLKVWMHNNKHILGKKP
ncbi:hypothetical protein Nepgr_016505 [Nepenthes gracilis]|uniref:ZF-HD dimerization-type domain-containing protein n=1 Tax=Nepenthes gracilis TaxID=150966 RepID=A0AAD3SPV0_NEPGR|nr:hypothetical protein Nepgr_016505 [Nepenthes gracilis]